jgi:hypothetical protein
MDKGDYMTDFVLHGLKVTLAQSQHNLYTHFE